MLRSGHITNCTPGEEKRPEHYARSCGRQSRLGSAHKDIVKLSVGTLTPLVRDIGTVQINPNHHALWYPSPLPPDLSHHFSQVGRHTWVHSCWGRSLYTSRHAGVLVGLGRRFGRDSVEGIQAAGGELQGRGLAVKLAQAALHIKAIVAYFESPPWRYRGEGATAYANRRRDWEKGVTLLGKWVQRKAENATSGNAADFHRLKYRNEVFW